MGAREPQNQSFWPSIINSVKTPLTFLIAALIVFAIVFIKFMAKNTEHTILPFVLFFLVLIFIVAAMVVLAIKKPNVVGVNSQFQDLYADRFASDLHDALEGTMANLEPMERADNWLFLANVLSYEGYDVKLDKEYFVFCRKVAARIKRSADILNHNLPSPGPIRHP